MVLEQFEPHLSECSIGHPISFFISIFFRVKSHLSTDKFSHILTRIFFHVVDCHIGDILIMWVSYGSMILKSEVR